MSSATRFARPRGIPALATAASFALALAAPNLALAQSAPATKPARTAPAQKPAAPEPQAQAQPGQAAQQGQTGPTLVQLKPEPSQTDWTKVCGKDQVNNFEICYTTRDFVSDQGQPVLAVAVYDIKGGAQAGKIVRFLMPLGLLLQPGVRFAVDQGQPNPGRYGICFPNGCFAEGPVKDDFVAALKKGTTLNISVQNSATREVTFTVPTAGFGKAFDGAPIDPKVLAEQQQKLQEELEKKSEELRKRLEQSNAAPGAPGAPSAAATPAKK